MSDTGLETPPPSLSRRARTAQRVALAAIVLTPSLYSFRFASFSDPKLLGWAVALLALAMLTPDPSAARRLLTGRFAPLAALLALSFVSASIAALGLGRSLAVPDYAFAAAAQFALTLLATVLVVSAFGPGGQARMLGSVAASGLPVAGLGLLQYSGVLGGMFPVVPGYAQRAYSVFGNQDLFGGYVALALSLGLALRLAGACSRVSAWAGAALLLPALLISGSRSAWLAAAIGCGVALTMYRPPMRKIAVGAGALALGTILMGLAAPDATWRRIAATFAPDDAGYRIRMWIWDGAARMFGDHPVLGVGLGNFQYYSPRYMGEALHARGPGEHAFNRLHTLHAHSDYAEVLAETGIVGAGLVVLFFVLLPRVKSAAWGGLAAGLAFSLANTTLHSPPHVIALLLCAAALPAASPRTVHDPRKAIPRLVFVLAAIVVGVGVILTVLVPSYLITRAEATLESGDSERIRAAYADAVGPPVSGFGACLGLGILRANTAHYAEAERLVDCALRGLDTADVHYLAGYVAEMQGDFDRAADAYAACVLRWPDHVRAWEGRLALAPEGERDGLLAEALPWLGPRAAERVTNLRERLRSGPVPRSSAAVR